MGKPDSDRSAPWHMWVAGVLLLIWTSLGAFDYVATIARFEPYLAQFPEDALAYYFNAPLWMFAMWGVSAIGGLISVIFLLLRKKIAVPIYGVALICSAVATVYAVINPAPVGASNVFMAAVIVVAVLVLVYFIWLQKCGVLR